MEKVESIQVRCLLCGKTYEIGKQHQEFKKLSESQSSTFICDLCSNKVRYESDDKKKAKKPMSC
ncbi:MAG: DUF2197 domain-containing protein [Bacillota bacterium]|nr:DUF2197 domain-containing protein [Bacillota bacterium]